MGKLRNGSTDLEQFTQWIGRKCRNHNPLAELTATNRSKLPRTYKARGAAKVEIVGEDKSRVLYKAGDRTFMVTVEEVNEADYAHEPKTAVGY